MLKVIPQAPFWSQRTAGKRALHLLQDVPGLADHARALVEARQRAPERDARHAALEAILVGRPGRVRSALPLVQLAQHQVELVEVGEFGDALHQQLQLLQTSHDVKLRQLS